jgi:L-asparaginase
MAEITNGMSKGVLVIYTGGTIGSKPKDPDPESPQVVVPWKELEEVTPELKQLRTRGFGRIDCEESVGPLDSCNVGPKEWAQMAQIIARNYENYEGFVILHGTDTMVYTASALSFMLKNLGKPVILTGAQRSALVDVRNDATQNFITALEIANPRFSRIPIIPEVCIYFGGKLLRGNRAIKRDTSGYEAYETPNLPPLGEAGDKITINEKLIRSQPTQAFRAVTALNPKVTTLMIYPGIHETPEIVRKQLLETDGLKAAVVLAYGSGNIPTLNDTFLGIFREARSKGIILVDASQCRRGPVELGIYDTSAILLEAGFIAANDITLEAALCKLMTWLGDRDMTHEEVEARFQLDEAGEQSISQHLTQFPGAKDQSLEVTNASPVNFRIPARPLGGTWESQRIDRALLRFRKAHLTSAEKEVQFRLFVNLDEPMEANESHVGYAGEHKKWVEGGDSGGIFIFDVTRAIKPIAKPGERVSLTLFLDTVGASFSWSEVELALFVREFGD